MTRLIFISACFLLLVACNDSGNNNSVDRTVMNNETGGNQSQGDSEEEISEPTNVKFSQGKIVQLMSSEKMLIQVSVGETFENKSNRNYKGAASRTYRTSNVALLNGENKIEKYLFSKPIMLDDIRTVEVNLAEDGMLKGSGHSHVDGFISEQEKINESDLYEKYIGYYKSLVFITYYQQKLKKLLIYNFQNDTSFDVLPADASLVSWKEHYHKSQIVVRYNVESNQDDERNGLDDENILIINPYDLTSNTSIFEIKPIKTKLMNRAAELRRIEQSLDNE